MLFDSSEAFHTKREGGECSFRGFVNEIQYRTPQNQYSVKPAKILYNLDRESVVRKPAKTHNLEHEVCFSRKEFPRDKRESWKILREVFREKDVRGQEKALRRVVIWNVISSKRLLKAIDVGIPFILPTREAC